MPFYCDVCGLTFKKSDPETYWCIETDLVKPVQERYIGEDKVYKQVVEMLVCKKCGCMKVQVQFVGKFKGKKKLLRIDRYEEAAALEYLNATEKVRHRQPQIFPFKKVPYSKRIPFVYGKAISPTKQRGRFINEQGWSGKKVYDNEVRVVSLAIPSTP
jgi:hypothetical protein